MGLLALDVGQSGIRAQISVDGDVLASLELPGARTNSAMIPQYAAAVQAALALSAQATGSVTQLAIGSTGLASTVRSEDLLAAVAGFGIQQVGLAHDSVTSYLGALHSESGVVIAAGTGVVAIALGEEKVARVDGWGNQMGDAGSGFWIGRAGLEMVMRAHDGRGPATALTGLLRADFPVLEDAYLEIQNDPNWVARVASYAKTIAGLAETDEVCANIIDAAAAELANTTVAALHRVGEGKQLSTLVATLGKVFNSTRLKDQFVMRVHQEIPGARFVKPLGDALDGAAHLLTLAPTSPLRSLVRYAA